MGSKLNATQATNALPICQSLLLCDSVIRDEVTHKTTVIGIFDTFYLPVFPGETPACMVFLTLGGRGGRYRIAAEVHDRENGVVLFRSPGFAKFGHPSKATSGELHLPVAPLSFDQPGEFDVEFVRVHPPEPIRPREEQPNSQTARAIEEMLAGNDVAQCESAEEMFRKLQI
jgi:Family of unknown function (DUF6941)